jgi:hypothetical protein
MAIELINIAIERCAREIEDLVLHRVPASEYAGVLRKLKIESDNEENLEVPLHTV